MWPLHHLRIIVDSAGHPLSAVHGIETEWDGTTWRVFNPGPFDSPGEVWERLCSEVDTQMQLWSHPR